MKIKVVCGNPRDADLGKEYLCKVVRSWNEYGQCAYSSLGSGRTRLSGNLPQRIIVSNSWVEIPKGRWFFGKTYTFEETAK